MTNQRRRVPILPVWDAHFARVNDWGYTRIMGELKKLGIKLPSRNTVKNTLKENGLEPGPKRGEGTCDEFLKMHAATHRDTPHLGVAVNRQSDRPVDDATGSQLSDASGG